MNLEIDKLRWKSLLIFNFLINHIYIIYIKITNERQEVLYN